jgi:hypothetical protein
MGPVSLIAALRGMPSAARVMSDSISTHRRIPMAHYTVTAGGCGHTATIQLFGPTRERERRIAWTESPAGLCNACYAARKRAESAVAHAAEVERITAGLRAKLEAASPSERAEGLRIMRSDFGRIAPTAANAARLEAVGRILAEYGEPNS